jgi:hypothetical protein
MPAGEYTLPDGALNFSWSQGATAEPPFLIQALAFSTI